MIRMYRPEVPECLKENSEEWTKCFQNSKEHNPKHKFRWPDQNCYKHIVKTLVTATKDHCAYCDGYLEVTSDPEIDHFRLLASYWAGAYEWSNLFPSCSKCNRSKLAKFSDKLLKPDLEDYSFRKYFLVDHHGGLIAQVGLTPEDQDRVSKTLEIFDLNAPNRKKHRQDEYDFFEDSASSESDSMLERRSYRYLFRSD